MTSAEAKKILIAYRAGRADGQDEQIAAALQQARRDPELRQWLEQQRAFHLAVEQHLQTITPPSGLREQILARTRVVECPWWRRPAALAAAAAIVLLLVVTGVWLRPEPSAGDSFATLRSRMVRAVLRQYAMDIETSDMAAIRQFLASRSAPADYVLPEKLAELPATGAGVLSWQGNRVSMVCLDSGTAGILFLFVVDQSDVKHPPPAGTEFAQINRLATVSWTEGDKAYVLAGQGTREWLEQFR